ncbi:zinc finger protein Eos isoform X1 [Rhea pennata]|uniref:zinc finger protein Eos isoform X1 n=1 Tax=Rhea pennata TaxID=8795 RepID=UPI002E259CC5
MWGSQRPAGHRTVPSSSPTTSRLNALRTGCSEAAPCPRRRAFAGGPTASLAAAAPLNPGPSRAPHRGERGVAGGARPLTCPGEATPLAPLLKRQGRAGGPAAATQVPPRCCCSEPSPGAGRPGRPGVPRPPLPPVHAGGGGAAPLAPRPRLGDPRHRGLRHHRLRGAAPGGAREDPAGGRRGAGALLGPLRRPPAAPRPRAAPRVQGGRAEPRGGGGAGARRRGPLCRGPSSAPGAAHQQPEAVQRGAAAGAAGRAHPDAQRALLRPQPPAGAGGGRRVLPAAGGGPGGPGALPLAAGPAHPLPQARGDGHAAVRREPAGRDEPRPPRQGAGLGHRGHQHGALGRRAAPRRAAARRLRRGAGRRVARVLRGAGHGRRGVPVRRLHPLPQSRQPRRRRAAGLRDERGRAAARPRLPAARRGARRGGRPQREVAAAGGREPGREPQPLAAERLQGLRPLRRLGHGGLLRGARHPGAAGAVGHHSPAPRRRGAAGGADGEGLRLERGRPWRGAGGRLAGRRADLAGGPAGGRAAGAGPVLGLDAVGAAGGGGGRPGAGDRLQGGGQQLQRAARHRGAHLEPARGAEQRLAPRPRLRRPLSPRPPSLRPCPARGRRPRRLEVRGFTALDV